MPGPDLLDDHLHPTVRDYVNSAPIATQYDTYFADCELFRYDCTFIEKHLRPPGPVLDVGCGTGRHVAHFAERGFTVVGLDLSPHMLLVARANLLARRQPRRLVQANFFHLPFKPGVRFQGILLMFSTLGLIHNRALRAELLGMLRGFLAPKGKLILHVHNRLYRKSPLLDRFAESVRARLGLTEPGDRLMHKYRGAMDLYLHTFDMNEMSALFDQSGLRLCSLVALNDHRNGPYTGKNPRTSANGFLMAAVSSDHDFP